MHITFEGTATLNAPSADQGFVTWIEARIFDSIPDTEESPEIGSARVALIHVGDASEAGELWDALDADSGELEALVDVYFDEAGLKEEFSQGVGEDLLYIESVEIAEGWQGQDLELLVVRRLIDVLGHGAELAVMPYLSPAHLQWDRMGFVVTRPARGNRLGYLHLARAFLQPKVFLSDDEPPVVRVEPDRQGAPRGPVN